MEISALNVQIRCSDTTSDYFQKLAMDIQSYLRDQMPVWRTPSLNK
jgi:hypothetical protein